MPWRRFHCLMKHDNMKAYWGSGVYLHSCLASALDVGECITSRSTTKERIPVTHCIRGWVVPTKMMYLHLFTSIQVGAVMAQWFSAGLRAGWSVVRIPAGAGNFSLHHSVQNGYGAHPACYPMSIMGSFPADKAVGAWSWPPTSI
jgi:hypothetical protein